MSVRYIWSHKREFTQPYSSAALIFYSRQFHLRVWNDEKCHDKGEGWYESAKEYPSEINPHALHATSFLVQIATAVGEGTPSILRRQEMKFSLQGQKSLVKIDTQSFLH